MVRKIQLVVPMEKATEVLELLNAHSHVHGVIDFVNSKKTCTMIMFNSVEKHLSSTLKELETIGLGHEFGTIDILQLQMSFPSLTKPKVKGYKRKYRLSDRQTVREIEEMIDSGAHLTFDFVAMTLVAGMIAAIGLLTDSAVTVVASMLVSPLMGAILCFSYGIGVRNIDMIKLGLRNECWGVFLCWLVGLVVGLVAGTTFYHPIGTPLPNNAGVPLLDASFEMRSRGEWISLVVGFFAAAPSGVGVALAVTNTSINALVGVAISASLLPPVVNCGICLMFGILNAATGDEEGQASRYFTVSAFSFALFCLNFATIATFAFLTFRLKGIHADSREFNRAPKIAVPPVPAPVSVEVLSTRQPSIVASRHTSFVTPNSESDNDEAPSVIGVKVTGG